MKLFEATWRKDFQFFERFYDTNLEKSSSDQISLPYEWYEPNSNGLYTAILDENIKLEKKQGNMKQASGNYGILDPMYRNIRDNYWNKSKYNQTPRIFYIDIEIRVGTNSIGFPKPEDALEPISLVQIYDNKSEILFVFGIRDWVHESEYHFDYNVKYIKCKDEIDLIQNFLKLFKALDPLIIYAWYGAGFDFPYIYNRLKKLGIDTNLLSNYGETSLSTKVNKENKVVFTFNSDGHFFIDLKVVYEKFVTQPRPNYKLDTIAEIELKERKVEHTEYTGFDDFYTGKYNIPDEPTQEQLDSKIYQAAIAGNWEEVKERSHSEFVYYGIIDTYLIKKIDEKLNFTSLMSMISEKMGVQISDSLGTVKPWAQYIANKSMLNKQVMPQRTEHDSPFVVGGFVREPVTGKLKWVLSGDVNSMYPLLGMVGFNMSPETFIPKYNLPGDLRDIILAYFNDQDESKRLELSEEIWETTTSLLKKYNYSLGINGAVFSKEKLGMIPEMVQEIYDSRKIAKRTQFEYEKRKILIQEIIKNKKLDPL